MTMDRNRTPDAHKPYFQLREATFHLDDGTVFALRLSAGCEKFVGRFTRLPEIRHKDHIIRFQDPVFAPHRG